MAENNVFIKKNKKYLITILALLVILVLVWVVVATKKTDIQKNTNATPSGSNTTSAENVNQEIDPKDLDSSRVFDYTDEKGRFVFQFSQLWAILNSPPAGLDDIAYIVSLVPGQNDGISSIVVFEAKKEESFDQTAYTENTLKALQSTLKNFEKGEVKSSENEIFISYWFSDDEDRRVYQEQKKFITADQILTMLATTDEKNFESKKTDIRSIMDSFKQKKQE